MTKEGFQQPEKEGGFPGGAITGKDISKGNHNSERKRGGFPGGAVSQRETLRKETNSQGTRSAGEPMGNRGKPVEKRFMEGNNFRGK